MVIDKLFTQVTKRKLLSIKTLKVRSLKCSPDGILLPLGTPESKF